MGNEYLFLLKILNGLNIQLNKNFKISQQILLTLFQYITSHAGPSK